MFTIFLRISLRSERQLTQTQRRQTTAVNGILVLSFSDGQEGFLPNVQLLVSLSYKRIWQLSLNHIFFLFFLKPDVEFRAQVAIIIFYWLSQVI